MRRAVAGLAIGSHALGDCAGRSAALAAANTAAGAGLQRRAVHQDLPACPARALAPSPFVGLARNHARHPVLLPKPLFLQLADSTAPTLKEFLAAKPGEVALCEVDDAGTEVDIDRPDDYAKAVALDVIRRAGK